MKHWLFATEEAKVLTWHVLKHCHSDLRRADVVHAVQ